GEEPGHDGNVTLRPGGDHRHGPWAVQRQLLRRRPGRRPPRPRPRGDRRRSQGSRPRRQAHEPRRVHVLGPGRRHRRRGRRLDGPTDLEAIAQPTLIVVLPGDLLHPVEVAEAYWHHIPTSRLIVETPGDGLLWDRPDDLALQVDRFLSEVLH